MKFFGFRSSNKLAKEIVISPALDAIYSDHDSEKQISSPDGTNDYNPSIQEKLDDDIPGGVKKIEAVTLTWTKHELTFAYAW